MRRFGLLLLVVGCLSLQLAFADSIVTMQFTGTGPGVAGGPNVSGGVYVYPYYFSINGSKVSTPLICDSYDNEVWTGESWKATVTPLTEYKGMLSAVTPGMTKQQAYEEAAYLFSFLGGKPSSSDAAGVNYAIWGLFASDVNATDYTNAGAKKWRDLADAAFTNNQITSSLLADYVVYTPIADTQSRGGLPQEYIGQVPEPASLALLGTGLLGMGGVIRRRLGLR